MELAVGGSHPPIGRELPLMLKPRSIAERMGRRAALRGECGSANPFADAKAREQWAKGHATASGQLAEAAA